jgi:transposase
MKYYVGLDVSMKKTSICIVNDEAKIVHESVVKADPQELAEVIKKTGFKIELVGFESGALSHYLYKELQLRELPVVCVEARHMSVLLSTNVNKTDKNDARGIAKALSNGSFKRVHQKPQDSIDRGAVLATRRAMIKQRTEIKNHIRGILKSYGIRLGSVGHTKFSATVKRCLEGIDALVCTTIEAALEIFDLVHEKVSNLDIKLAELAKEDKEVCKLMTVPGIGPITAMTYKTEIFDPMRFSDSRTVGAYLGMTPTQYSSGEIHKQGRISKCGSKELRSLLTESGVVILTRSKKWSKLKAWGLKLMRKKGIRKAALAVGRKLAVIMHRMLVSGKEFIYGEEPLKQAA